MSPASPAPYPALQTKPTLDLRVMMIDFNSYFASVEQQLNPALRGRAVGVVPMMAESTCCIAASYEAKAFGVKTGTRVAEARKLCPDIVLIEAQHVKYVQMHHRALAVVNQFIPVEAVHSIDEMSCLLTPRWQSAEAALELAQQIKTGLLSQLGVCMKTSIGVGSNRFLAKTASNLQKPDGLVLLRAADLPQALARLEIEHLTGIGRNVGMRLRRHGIDTVSKLYTQNRQQLRTVWGGIGGEYFWEQLHGVPDAPSARGANQEADMARSIGHSHVLAPHERSAENATQVLDRLLQKAAMRLRKETLCTTQLSVFIGLMKPLGDSKRPYWEAQSRLPATSDTRVLLNALHTLLKSWWGFSTLKPLKVGVVLSGLNLEKNITLSLFDAPQAPAQAQKLNAALDALNVKFGKNTVYFAKAHQALDSAPMRIAFNRIPDVMTEHA